MTDQGRPLSRRERREAEVRKAAPDQPTTPIPSTVAGPPTHPDGTPLTRKERRALERGEHGVETWTQEEELIATGQLPAMTPDLLEAQEMIARRRAERAAAPVAEEPVAEPESAPESAVEAETVAETQAEPEAEAPVEPEPVMEAQPEPEPVAEPEPEPVADVEPEPEPEPAAPVWEPEVIAQAETQPMAEPIAEPIATAEPEPETQPEAEAEPEPELPTEEPTPTGAIDTIPEEYRHLFPPGSLQARRLEERAARGETATPPTGTPETPAVQDAGDDPAAEIRRLTAEAMAGITRAQQARRAPAPEALEPPEETPEAPAEDTAADEPVAEDVAAEPEPQPDAPEPGVLEEDVETEILDPADVYAQAESASAPDGETDLEEDAEETAYAPALAAELAGASLPQRGTAVTEAPAPAETETATAATPSGGSAIVPAGMRHVSQASASAPTRWESHPLAQAQPREVADYAPSEDIPIPDFTKIMHGYASTSSSAGTAPAGEVGDEPSGTDLPGMPGDEYPRRPQPDAPDEGAHHFAWAHLAVIGAVAFLLGVLVWHLTGNA
ncbi:hypothetical protein [Demequina rhizosphaerae]|uniref:hypothetical protein n=1 Tax=Demequina rhizosphaerae TaxID=1638985 RepID=UPI000AE2839B|nr:hypothetical protein [Demequina rhizosphaerae]